MAGRRPLVAVIVLASALHAFGIARTRLPAQDGLKFLRVARAFQTQPWIDVVRGSDQHPLYPALVAIAEPVASLTLGRGPDTWRIAAQVVSALAAILLLIPLHGLTTRLFSPPVANLAALGLVLLPFPMAVGHDTLSDALALAAFVTALRLGQQTLDGGDWKTAVGCGLVSGLGFLTRPEALVVPLAVSVAWLARWPVVLPSIKKTAPGLAGLSLAFLTVVGSYALVKGQVSEKLALRIGHKAHLTKPSTHLDAHALPAGLDDPRWDFSPKEEPADVVPRRFSGVLGDLAFQWAAGLGWVLALLAAWGVVRDRFIRSAIAGDGTIPDRSGNGRRLILVYLALFTPILARHEMKMGYLSGRHVLTLIIVSLPWAAAGVYVCAKRLGGRIPHARLAGVALLAVCLAVSVAIQSKPAHPSRWGHWMAGRWLAENATPGQAVLDTRGWASFVSGRPAYDYWHVRQAFSDSRLSYVVVGEDERNAPSRRGATLRAVLAYAAKPAAVFPERAGEKAAGVRVYRFHRPESWEGLRP